MLHGTFHILTDNERTGSSILVPPPDKCIIISGLITDFPIDLGHTIVKPAVIHPQQHIGIKVVIILQTIGIAANWRIALVTIDAKGRDTDFHPRLGLMDRLIELFNKEVHVIATPVALVLDTVGVILKEFIVRNTLPLNRIGIEVIIHMDTIHIVAAHDITGYLADIVAIFRNTGVQDKELVVGKAVHRLTHSDMHRRELTRALGLCPIGIDPCMQFHPALVTLINHPLQGIPVGFGCYALGACQETAPRLNLTLVKGITLRTDLKDNHVDAVLLQLIELIGQRLLHLHCTHALELSVDALYPGTTHLTFLSSGCQSEQKHQA